MHLDWKQETTHSATKQHIERHIDPENNLLKRLKESGISDRTSRNITELYDCFGKEKIFSRKDVLGLLQITEKPASTLIKKMESLNMIEKVSGLGKGKYRFVWKEA